MPSSVTTRLIITIIAWRFRRLRAAAPRPLVRLRARRRHVCAPSHAPGETMIRAAACCLVVLIATLVPALAVAQSFPTHPVKFVVPFPGGGINDVLARIVGDKLQAKWGQPVVVENRTGAGGNIGAEVAAQAEPDGHTILVAPPGPLAINKSLYKRLAYNSDDFVPITLIGSVPNLVIVRNELPVSSVRELIDYIRQND